MQENINNLKNRLDRYTTKTDYCWEWNKRLSKGYGSIHFNGKKILAHRASWLVNYAEIPKNLLVLHKCDNAKCVNPQHLFLGTQKDNIHDMIKKGRARFLGNNFSRYVASEDHPLTIEKVTMIRRLLSDKAFNQREIAFMFSVAQQTVSEINTHRNWKVL